MQKVKGGTRKGAKRWPRNLLLQLVIEAGAFASKDTNDPSWPVSMALMVSIYRDESAKIRAIDNFNLTAGMDSGTGSSNDDWDEDIE